MSSVFSMLPEGMRNASTTNVRSRRKITSATASDFTHSLRLAAVDRCSVAFATRVLRAQSFAGSTQSAMKMLVSPGTEP